MKPIVLLAWASMLALLTGCLSAPRMDDPVIREWENRRAWLSALDTWTFTGSIHVRDASDSHSSRIRWQQMQQYYQINLWGTFNVGATQIDGGPDAVRIAQQGEDPVITDSPEALLFEQLGYELPVTELNFWIKGIPAPGRASDLRFGDNNQLVHFSQAGWQIDYLGYTNFGDATLPNRIRIQKEPLRLDLTRLTWTLPDSITDTTGAADVLADRGL